MALDPVAHLEWGPWDLGCPADKQIAVSWVYFGRRKDGDETV